MSKNRILERAISTDRPINEVWNGLLTPDPFPGNLFIKDETTYVCYPLGTGRIGGFRFDYGNHKWLIFRLTEANIEAQSIKWNLVDIKRSSIRKLEIIVSLNAIEVGTNVHIRLNAEYSLGTKVIRFLITRSLRKRLNSFVI